MQGIPSAQQHPEDVRIQKQGKDMSEPTPFQQTVHILDIDTIQTQSNGVERSLFSQSILVHVIFCCRTPPEK